MHLEPKNIQFQAGVYVSHLLSQELPIGLLFHNLNHTINVVDGVQVIGQYHDVSKSELEILTLAAWFHDTGHIITYEGHEAESQQIADSFLKKHQYPAQKLKLVLSCIAATKMPQRPSEQLQAILCDADLYHLTFWEYPFLQQQLREEQERVHHTSHTDQEWNKLNLHFLEDHHYHTDYGRVVLQKQKEININKCRTLITD